MRYATAILLGLLLAWPATAQQSLPQASQAIKSTVPGAVTPPKITPEKGFIERYQGGLGPLVGLATILLGAMPNAHMNRRRDDRLRHEEAKALTAALQGEAVSIELMLRTLRRNIRLIRPEDGDSDTYFAAFKKIPYPIPIIYQNNVGKIGVITDIVKNFPEEIVCFFSGVIHSAGTYNANVAILEHDVAAGDAMEINSARELVEEFIDRSIGNCTKFEPILADFAGVPRAERDSDGNLESLGEEYATQDSNNPS